MGKKNKKAKKVSAKRERYAKFRKEKPASVDITMPDLSDDQIKQKREDEEKINRFLRFNRNRPTGEIVKRREKSKR
ncbi:hypothetical protein KY343_04875 [Candidatus Woesearchaeota archaeon]|nr:hypothetical protein [Candidatus Woesearchaeota archaeon]